MVAQLERLMGGQPVLLSPGNQVCSFTFDRLPLQLGGSVGGQQALEWAVSYPELVEKVAVIAATAALTAQSVAFSEVERQAIMADPRWNEGNYEPGEGPATGLAIARMLAMITYQSEE